MKSKLPLLFVVLLLVAMAAGWWWDRQRVAAQWSDLFTQQMKAAAQVANQYVTAYREKQAWPPVESIQTALEHNGTTMAGPTRIDRYACGPDGTIRFDVILRSDGQVEFLCENRR